MNQRIRNELKNLLTARGFKRGLESPNGTMVLDEKYLDETSLGEFFDLMVTRREKISRSQSVVGREAMIASHADVSAVVDAIKEIIEGMGSA